MASLHFTHPEFLLLLVALPLLIFTHYYLFKFTKRKAMHFANLETIKRVTGKGVMTRNITQLVLRLFVFVFIVFALTQPEIWYDGAQQKSDYVLAIDTSASMTADDLTPNRFEAAKQAAIQFLEQINTTAQIGAIGFSGTSTVLQTPTTDKEQVKTAIGTVEIQPVSGTDISNAIITGTNLLINSGRGRVIILFTDGSATVGSFAGDSLAEGVAYAKDRQVVVHTVAMGQPNSVPSGYLPRLYNVSAAFNDENLQYIADQTGGLRLSGASDEQLGQAYRVLLSDSASGIQTRPIAVILTLLALMLLFVEWGLLNTRFRLIP